MKLSITDIQVRCLIWTIFSMFSFYRLHSIFSQLHISHRAFGSLSSPSSAQTPREVCWQHGDNDTLVLNVDGSALTNPGQAGYGGIVHNSGGKFLFGFYGSVGLSNILHAEIQALLTGITLCCEAGFKKIVCFSDSLHVVQLVAKETPRFHHYANLRS